MGKIPIIDDEIEQDFLDGSLEIYDTIFSEKVPFYFLNTESTEVNSYGETLGERQYDAPVYLTARVVIEAKMGEKAVNRTHNTATIRVPTQNLWDNKLAVEAEDLAKMRHGKFTWNGIDYQVKRIRPKTLINNTFIFHDFYCEEIVETQDYAEGVD